MKKLIALGIVVFVLFLVGKTILWSMRFVQATGLTPTIVGSLIVSDGVTLKSKGDMTNILLLGVGGGTHEGADLTDTMMIVSLDSEQKTVALISIPRDTWSETLKDRVNSAYHYGEAKKKGGGLLLAKVISEDVVGIPIHYTFLLDFSGFKEIIDILGGIEVNVSKAFTDNDFPIAGKEKDTCPGDPKNRCVYETIHFDAGVQHMDGQLALKYVRSRHAEGDEGSDFARSRRQQDVLVALKDTLVHPARWFSLNRIAELQDVVAKATDTDMNLGELATVAKKVAQAKNDQIQKITFEKLLYVPPSYMYGRYTLVPIDDWNAIHAFISESLQRR